MPGRKRARVRVKRATFRIVYTPELTAELRRLYEGTAQSLHEIAAPHGLSRRTLAMKARREGWVRFERPALGLSGAVRLDARLAEAEKRGLPPPERGRPPSVARREGVIFPDLETTPTRPAAQADLPLAGGGEEDRAGGGEPTAAPPASFNFDSALQGAAAAALDEAQRLIQALKAAREQAEETGRYSQFSQLGRDLAAITNSLYRIKRIWGGAPDGDLTGDDDPSDLDARRDELARRIEIIVAEWRDAEAAGGVEPA